MKQKLTGIHKELYEKQQKEQQERIDQQRKAQKAGLLADTSESYAHLKFLFPEESQSAYRSLMYLRKRFRRVKHKIQEDINKPDTDEKERLILIGKMQGINQVFDYIANVRHLKNEADKGAEGFFADIVVTNSQGKEVK